MLALVFRVFKFVWLSPEILPIVGVDAYIPLMVDFIMWAPDGLKMEGIEIRVLFLWWYHMNEVNSDVMDRMGKATEHTIIT